MQNYDKITNLVVRRIEKRCIIRRRMATWFPPFISFLLSFPLPGYEACIHPVSSSWETLPSDKIRRRRGRSFQDSSRRAFLTWTGSGWTRTRSSSSIRRRPATALAIRTLTPMLMRHLPPPSQREGIAIKWIPPPIWVIHLILAPTRSVPRAVGIHRILLAPATGIRLILPPIKGIANRI